MALRVSLQIDGDAKGAEAAAEAASRAIINLGKSSDAASKSLQDGFDRAAGNASGLAGSTKAAGAANDNFTASAIGFVGQLDQIAQKALGSDTAISKLSAGTASVARGISALSSAGGTIGFVSGALGIAVTVASTFYGIVTDGSRTAERTLAEQARLVGVVQGAYSNASKTAGDFYAQSREVTALQIQQNLLELKALRDKAVAGVVGDFDKRAAAYSVTEIDFNGKQKPNPYQQEADILRELQGAVDSLRASLAAGSADAKIFQDEIARIGNAASATNPELTKEVGKILERSSAAADYTNKINQQEAAQAQHNGTATAQQRALLGIRDAAKDTTNEFDRMVKSMQRQAAAQEAEAAATGKSIGESAKLRGQYLLTEAATQANIKVTGEYAEKLALISNRLGDAAQKSALARLQSDLGFERSQFGRNSDDAAIADRLRGVFGDDVSAAMKGATGDLVRFNNEMRELKGVSIEVAQGAFRDFRTELMNGASAWEAFDKAGTNALGRITDKLGDKALDSIVSKIFGSAFSFGGGGAAAGGTGLSLTGTGGLFYDGGFTGFGEKHEPAGIVHRGEYVIDAANTARIGVANLDRLRGYAEGGYVTSASGLGLNGRSRLNASSSVAPIQITSGDINVTITGNADDKTVAEMRRMFAERDARFHSEVVQSVKDATTWQQL